MVSIILVTYNRAKRLRLSIQDILNQTFTDFELIICDDCSPDDTEAVCREFEARDNRIKYFRHAQNKQMPANLNFGISQAQFECIAILHDGDRFRKDLIEQWYNAMRSHPNVGVVFNSLGDSDQEDRIVRVVQGFDEGVVSKDHLLKAVFFRNSNFGSPIYGEAMVRKSLIQRYGYLKQEYSFYADVDLWMEILHTHDAYFCADVLIKTPLKDFQPQQFFNNIVRFYIMLFRMSKHHRMKAFRNRPIRLISELAYYYGITIWYMTYVLLIVTKNFPFRYFLSCRKELKNHLYLMPLWAGILVAYPVLRPLLRAIFASKPAPQPDEALMEKSEFMFS
jgi:glycosyltransferase involved in cell wall biosynthesis